MKKKKLSVVIACYKDAQAIPVMHSRLSTVLKKMGIEYEIIFVNDGSPDNTEQVLAKLTQKDQHVIGVNHSRNFSSQMAFTSGMNISKGDAVIFMDGDLQDPPELIPEFFKKYEEGFDVVYGIRVKREETWYMQLLYKLFYRFFTRVSYLHMPVDAGDFSLIDRKVISALQLFPERDRFIRGLRAWVGFNQIGVPYMRPKRMFGVSTNNFFKNFRWAIKGIFSFSYIPLEMITNLSLMVCIASFLGIIWQVIDRIIDPGTPRGITTILVVVLFLGAIQLLAISILGEYLMKIFEEVKQRPHYIVKSIMKKK